MSSSGEIFTCTGGTKPFYPQAKKSTYFEYDFTDDKPSKRDKKWSFGNLFRRKKKVTDDNSDEETKIIDKKKSQKQEKKKVESVMTINAPIIRTPDESRTVTLSNSLSSSYGPTTPQYASYDQTHNRHNKNQTSSEFTNKRSSRILAKVRAEAKRNSLNQSSSSDEDSQRSSSSNKFRSDKCLYKSKESSSCRKSKASRTERYLRRHSKDSEILNTYSRISKFEVEPVFLKVSDDNLESTSPSPLEFISTSSKISPKLPSYLGRSTIPLSNANNVKMRNSVNNLSYKPFISTRESNSSIFELSNDSLNNQRSISFDADIHKSRTNDEVIHAKLELGKPRSKTFTPIVKPSHYSYNREPPLPPPRDPKRLQGPHYMDINRNTSSPPFHNYDESLEPSVKKLNYLNSFPTFKSSSEDHIPQNNSKYLIKRPSSTTPESNIRWNSIYPGMASHSEDYRYLTDKQSRSRKPIFIKNNNNSIDNKNLRDQRSFGGEIKFEVTPESKKSQKEAFLPSVLVKNNQKNEIPSQPVSKPENPLDEKKIDSVISEVDDKTFETKSANLEEALNELEAIYNSLKLGDENLLEMAEKREQEIVNNKILENKTRNSNLYAPRGAMSDSGFSYECTDLNMPRRKRYYQKTLKTDDMAFRKLQRESSPYVTNNCENFAPSLSGYNEPDITLDDVVYRNIQQCNKLKVPEHPPPFGIPLGPIALASNSDYLHAVPTEDQDNCREIPDLVKDDLAYRSLRKDHNKSAALPPVSAEDLKNNNLGNFSMHKYESPKIDLFELRKSRPVRSKSANIGSLLSLEVIEKASRRNAQDKHTEPEYKILSNIADAMHKARQVLKDKEEKITEHKWASMSDTDSTINLKYTRYPAIRSRSNISTDEPIGHPSDYFDFDFTTPKIENKIGEAEIFDNAANIFDVELNNSQRKYVENDNSQNNEYKSNQNIADSTNSSMNEVAQTSDHDYENISSDNDCNLKTDKNSSIINSLLKEDFSLLRPEDSDTKATAEEPDYCNLVSKRQKDEPHENSPGET